jgi:hypothetical protein
MKTFIFKYLLIIAAVAEAISVTPSQDLSSMSATYWLKPYKQQLWTPQGF